MSHPYPHLFSSGRIGRLELKNRLVMPPMGTGYAADDGTASERWIRYLEARARGGIGLMITEVTAIRPEGRGFPNEPGIYDDRFLPGLQELVRRLHTGGAKVAVQLHHAGRQTIPDWNGGFQPVAPSPIPCPAMRAQPKELTVEEIENLVEAFADGALRAKNAGFDAVEVHGAHGYLVGQFLSPSTNKRSDPYGGPLEKRLRFPLEIIARIRERVGTDFPLLFRISAEERVRDGLTLEESKIIAVALQGAGIDALNVSVGTYAAPGSPGIGPMDLDPGFLIPAAEALKKILQIPVIGVGRIHLPEEGEEILREGKVDFLAVGRALLADPDFALKAEAGLNEKIRRCIACNQGCIDRLFMGKSITCLVNPQCGREMEFPPARAGHRKRVLVIGGGPAGLQAARVAALRGHEVTLLEKENVLGGQFLAAAVPPKKGAFQGAMEFLAREVEESGAKIERGTMGGVEELKRRSPDAVIVATGSKAMVPEIKGLHRLPFFQALDVLLGKKEIPYQKILILGGGMVGVEVADFLAEKGKQITIIEMGKRLAAGVGPGHWYYVHKRLLAHKVDIHTQTVVEEVQEKGVSLRVHGEPRFIQGIEAIILAVGAQPQKDVVEKLKVSIPEVYVIGDAREVRNALEASMEGMETGLKI